jgi:hypothetical protein
MKFMTHNLKIVRKAFKKFACGAYFTKIGERIEREMKSVWGYIKFVWL